MAQLKCKKSMSIPADAPRSVPSLKAVMLPGGAAVPLLPVGGMWVAGDVYDLTDGEASALLQSFAVNFEPADDRARLIAAEIGGVK